MTRARLSLIALLVVFNGCVSTRPRPASPSLNDVSTGLASWYGQEFAGRLTANGEVFDPMLFTAAHRTLPFGSIVQIRNPQNGKAVDVRINDRGPFINNRIIDLSYAAAEELGLVRAGVAPVEMMIVKLGGNERGTAATAKSAPRKSAKDPDQPPSVDFPLPVTTSQPTPVQESDRDFGVAVVEQRQGEVIRKRASADGQTIERVPARPDTTTARRESVPESPLKNGYVVQLGSFQQQGNALALRAKIPGSIGPAFVDHKGSTYRVRVGPYPSRTEAIEAREKLEGEGYSGFIVETGSGE